MDGTTNVPAEGPKAQDATGNPDGLALCEANRSLPRVPAAWLR